MEEMNKEEGHKFIRNLAKKIGDGKRSQEDMEKFENIMFTNKYITCDGRRVRVPRCFHCWGKMHPIKDKIAGKITGYSWQCDCKHYPSNIILCVG